MAARLPCAVPRSGTRVRDTVAVEALPPPGYPLILLVALYNLFAYLG